MARDFAPSLDGVDTEDGPDFAPAPSARLRGKGPLLGTLGKANFRIDLEKLMATRLFIQAASGGGKSWALRRILEQTHSKVQQIVIDPEGELVTLAEKYDFIVCSADSETAPLSVDTAFELASTIYRSGQSVILALDSFDVEEMQEFVEGFLKGLMAEPKEHWHYCMLAIDEAQLFAPQHDKAKSKKPMLDLAARARKRGICPVVATQRISQIHKGVTAHLENTLVGLTTLDTDIDRAADQLGMKVTKAAGILKRLNRGDFMVYGPALSYDVVKVTVGPVNTRHGALGKFDTKKPKPSMNKRSLLKVMKELAPPPRSQEDLQGAGIPALPLVDVIAHMRHWSIAPLLKEAPWGAVAARARELNLSQIEVNNWFRVFQQCGTTESLRPQRVHASMLDDARRLSPGWSPAFLALPA